MAIEPTEIDEDIIIMSPEEILYNIDLEARALLNMSGEHFMELWRRGELPDTPATFDIGMLASLLENEDADSSKS